MSSYRGDLSPSELDDMESWEPQGCKRCGGKGYISRFRQTGNPMAADPCGCDEPEEDQ